ncbi:TetR/AcrR family transcriptional regulator [Williamsia sp. CHRR-6]|uniref:TetR/AcrR family transcriptional regulator n=1 Tax=Williamsia sp. CHRR-6 TaxID=2835871 RepID=UPI001BDAB28E|nr:TetR family transcriptional regulator [Williamsia sp. CHRR-6]MBT0565604.1 TetR family transcriptional regulator [Williamsia sp. CHRR-6]
MKTRRATVARGTGRDVLLDATLRLIGERGLHAITLREVADAAGLSLGSTTYHFADRDALLTAALSRYADSVVAHCDEISGRYEGSELDPVEVLRSVVNDFGNSYCTPNRMMAQLELYTESGRNPTASDISARCLNAYRRMLVSACVRAGIDEETARTRVGRILVYADGLALQSAATRTPFALGDEANEMLLSVATATL